MLCSPHRAGLGSVNEDVVLREALDVSLDLVHFLCKAVHTVLLAHGVQWHHVVGLLLELGVQRLPLLLQSSNQLLTLVIWHQEFLAVTLGLLLNLHFTHEVVLVLNLVLNLGQVLGDGAVVLLLQVVFVFLLWQLGCGQDVLNSVGNDKVLVGNEAVDWLFVLLGHGWLGLARAFKFGDFLLVDEDWVASALLFKSLGVWLDSADWLAEGGSIGSVRVRAALQVELAGKIGANWL